MGLKTEKERKGGEHVDSFCFFGFEIASGDPSFHIIHNSCSAAAIDKYTFSFRRCSAKVYML